MLIRRTREDIDDARRAFLLRAMALGLFSGGMGWNLPALAQLFGRVPRRLPEGRSIFEMRGRVLVNGQPATYETRIGPTDKLETADGSFIVAAVGGTAFILRQNSSIELDGRELLVRSMRLVRGALLSVFGKRRRDEEVEMRTVVATIGIRGTGAYAEVDPEKTYFCTCYGTTDIRSEQDRNQTEQIVSRHHDAPRYVLATPDANGRHIIPAPFFNHTDLELMTIEAIVGREVPFGVAGLGYEGPQRDY
ncbi:MAG: hypothetical protein ACT4QA_20820 [Panacagrimonas sp.]